MVKVTNLKNNKSVIVRINNRGPYAKGRILDLSMVAARKIDMTRDGIIAVRAEVLKPIKVLSKPNRSFPGMEPRDRERGQSLLLTLFSARSAKSY